jgi:hypothetical protein
VVVVVAVVVDTRSLSVSLDGVSGIAIKPEPALMVKFCWKSHIGAFMHL